MDYLSTCTYTAVLVKVDFHMHLSRYLPFGEHPFSYMIAAKHDCKIQNANTATEARPATLVHGR
jgi:hypothetical protein